MNIRVPPGWNLPATARTGKLRASAYGINDAPIAFYRTLCAYLLGEAVTVELLGLHFAVSLFGSRPYFLMRAGDRSAGIIATHIYDIMRSTFRKDSPGR